jgi:hypothetical protein
MKNQYSNPIPAIFIFFLFSAISYSGFSQRHTTDKIHGLNARLSEMRQSSDPSVADEAENLNSLVNDLKPTLYYKEKAASQPEDGIPVRLYSDVSSLQLLTGSNPLFSQVRLLCIKVEKPEDLQSVLDLSGLNGISKLKYVYFLCTFSVCADQQGDGSCEKEKIASMMSGAEPEGVDILYSVNIDN